MALLMHGRTRVMRYHDLTSYPSIEAVLQPYGNAIILYPSAAGRSDVGHWTCVFYTVDERGCPCIEFFDPYGIFVDNELKFTRNNTARTLAKLLYASPYPIVYNDYGIQLYQKNINTCGKHVINRLRHSGMSLDRYAQCFGAGGDRLVSELINI